MNTVPLQIEAELARLNVLRMVRAGGSGHLGGALSCIDIVTALYFATMRVNPQAPKDPNRDRFLLSAGHKAMAQYAVLGRRGYFEETLYDTYGSVGSKLGGHPDLHKLPGIEANTGALGHGLSIAAGMALGLRAAGNGGRVFTVLGDGELPEGANWEGASIAAHHRLDNLVAFVDVNDLQISGPTAEVMNMEPIADKFAAFGWNTVTIDGNDIDAVLGAVSTADGEKGRPTVVVARTTKAKGISFLEGTLASHYWKPTVEELDRAEREVHARIDNLREWNDHGC
ncbi:MULTISPECIES: transketolase [Tessaracoccus]|jgi:transketolase|uniref:Transketolase n=1 Tax=Tessaracoccus lapidicaptus TaxID=1427523 RepID=A0A1C0APT3_9ACTN|nr:MULTISPECIES: transketolase [Tessaracoccus]AQX16397.1 transketolase [Tessaracoccus sp. T2.5-30]OCL36302.1 transketolase [Tessaracoccus lapidicaptus]VEP41034.1 Ferredoxin fas2 [Tessaracoccus lapidicaptus]HNV76789.1 transketolase [Gemmatimonadaceae bacterium]